MYARDKFPRGERFINIIVRAEFQWKAEKIRFCRDIKGEGIYFPTGGNAQKRQT